MSLVQIILVVIVAFIIGCGSVNVTKSKHTSQLWLVPYRLVTGHLELGVMLW